LADYSQSEEDYLETLYIIQLENKVIRVKDVAEAMAVKMPSVVTAIRSLSEKGLVEQEKYGHIELTKKGIEVAKSVYAKHRLLFTFFHDILGLNQQISEKDACRIEHHLSPQTQKRLLKIVEYIHACKADEMQFLKRFTHFLSTGKVPAPCKGCKKEEE